MTDSRRADAGLQRKREPQLERVARAMQEAVAEPGAWADRAKAVLAAVPDPYIKKERARPKLPTDDVVLCAMRGEFVDLVRFIEANSDHILAERPLALARALREQGVVL